MTAELCQTPEFFISPNPPTPEIEMSYSGTRALEKRTDYDARGCFTGDKDLRKFGRGELLGFRSMADWLNLRWPVSSSIHRSSFLCVHATQPATRIPQCSTHLIFLIYSSSSSSLLVVVTPSRSTYHHHHHGSTKVYSSHRLE